MGARVFRPEFDQSRFDAGQIGGDYYAKVSQEILVPRIIERQKQALNVIPTLFRFYQRSYGGRRCSCWSRTEVSASSQCVVCFGTGNTGGYQLYGHRTEVFDATAQSASVGVVLDFTEVTRPLSFRLAAGAVRGYLDFTLPPGGGANRVTLASLHAVAPRGTRVRSACRLFTEGAFVPLSVAALQERIAPSQMSGGIHLRIVLERDSIKTCSPKFSLLRIRYQTLTDDIIRGDVPLSAEGNRSSEYGFFEDVDTKSLYLDATLRTVTTEDLFRQVSTGRLWKVERVTPNEVGGLLTSWSAEMRITQPSERYAMIP